MKYHTLFFRKLGKISQKLSSASVVIGALRVKFTTSYWKVLEIGISFAYLMMLFIKDLT